MTWLPSHHDIRSTIIKVVFFLYVCVYVLTIHKWCNHRHSQPTKWYKIFADNKFSQYKLSYHKCVFIAAPHLSFPCCSSVTQYLPSGFVPASNVGKNIWDHSTNLIPYIFETLRKTKREISLSLLYSTCANKQRKLTLSRQRLQPLWIKFYVEWERGSVQMCTSGRLCHLQSWIG